MLAKGCVRDAIRSSFIRTLRERIDGPVSMINVLCVEGKIDNISPKAYVILVTLITRTERRILRNEILVSGRGTTIDVLVVVLQKRST